MIGLFRISLLAALAMALTSASIAAPWVGGRGVGNQGAFPDVTFPPTPSVVWKAFLGTDFSKMVPSNTLIFGDNVIVAYGKSLLSLSAKTGEPRWKTDLYEPPLGDMLLLEGKVIVSTQHGFIFAFDPDTGKQLWKCRLTDSLRNNPVLFNGVLLYTTKSNTIESVDLKATADNKRVTVRLTAPDKMEATPIVIGKSLILCFADGTIMRLDDNGMNRWTLQIPNTVLGWTPATNGKIAVISTATAVYAIDPFEQDLQKAIRWTYPCVDQVADAAVLSGNRVYVATRAGLLHALDLATGKDVWSHEETAAEKISTKAKGGTAAAVSVTEPVSAKKVDGIKLPATPIDQPTVLGQQMLIRMESGLIALVQKDNGKISWMYKMMPPNGAAAPKKYFAGMPALNGDDVYFAGTDTVVYHLSKSALDVDPPAFSRVLPDNAGTRYVTPDGVQYIGAVITDEGSGLSTDLVKIKLDDLDFTPQLQQDAQSGFYYAPLPLKRTLTPGLHRLLITAKDYKGNTGTLNQSFIVAPGNADFIEINIAGEYVPKAIEVRPGTVISWRNIAGGPRTVVSDAKDQSLQFSSDASYPDGIPNKERWAWIVPEDAEPGALIYYHCRLQGKAGDDKQFGEGLAGLLKIVDQNPMTVPVGPGPVTPGAVTPGPANGAGPATPDATVNPPWAQPVAPVVPDDGDN